MCDFKFIKELPNKTVKKWAAFIREMRHSKKDDPAAFDCEALGLIPRRLRRNSKAFFINQYPAPWGGVVNFVSPPKEELAERGKACSAA
jgi:hypothetical protein